ncbi:MAG: ATP-binding cassette domain-containing protein [Ruaniaceae bacterium]|nr:ATP-binding cassette domain-containing protein [Ruaniaceae bacterium]
MRLTVAGVGHQFGDQPFLFRDLSAELISGRSYAVTGPSGSGKTTLLAILAGMISPSIGVVERPPACRFGWVFQNPHGVHQRSALDHVSLPFISRGLTRRAADSHAMELMEDFGLSHRARARFSELSGGEAQRLLLARGVAAAPDVLLVDEPTAQLDAVTSLGVNEALRATAGRDTVVVVATHDEGTRRACTDHIDLGTYT